MGKIVEFGKLIAESLTSIAFPYYCPGCNAEFKEGVDWICPRCWRELPEAGGGVWSVDPRLKENVFVSFHYGDLCQQMVHQMKFVGRCDIAPKLGREAALRLRQWNPQPSSWEVIVPVPLHPIRRRERGYDQNRLLAGGAAEVLGVPVADRLIRRIRHTPPQSRLADPERVRNIARAFAPTGYGAPPKSALLIDDVIHTGATLMECRAALKAAGVARIGLMAACG